jgi:hypothetical protein
MVQMDASSEQIRVTQGALTRLPSNKKGGERNKNKNGNSKKKPGEKNANNSKKKNVAKKGPGCANGGGG